MTTSTALAQLMVSTTGQFITSSFGLFMAYAGWLLGGIALLMILRFFVRGVVKTL